MRWISNGDAPIYIWEGDTWYNQRDKLTYYVNLIRQCWSSGDSCIYFTKKTKVMK